MLAKLQRERRDSDRGKQSVPALWACENGFGCQLRNNSVILSHRLGQDVRFVEVCVARGSREEVVDSLIHWSRGLVLEHPRQIDRRDIEEWRFRLRETLANPINPHTALFPADWAMKLLEALEAAIEPPKFAKRPSPAEARYLTEARSQ